MKHADTIHALTSGNKEMIEASGRGICLYCGMGHDADAFDFIEGEGTALCPACDVDAVIPEMTPTLVAALRRLYFGVRK
jgi:hypothetical protein